jgi:hypothetical protein
MIASAQATEREDLRRLSELLATFRRGLLELRDRIPADAEEQGRQDLAEDARPSTRLRADLDCLLVDFVDPALHTLQRLAAD